MANGMLYVDGKGQVRAARDVKKGESVLLNGSDGNDAAVLAALGTVGGFSVKTGDYTGPGSFIGGDGSPMVLCGVPIDTRGKCRPRCLSGFPQE